MEQSDVRSPTMSLAYPVGLERPLQIDSDFMQWTTADSFSYTPGTGTGTDESAGEYFSLSANPLTYSPVWPPTNTFTQAPLSSTLPSLSHYATEELAHSDPRTLEIDSDLCGVSPIDQRRPAPEQDSVPGIGWESSWSQQSSPSMTAAMLSPTASSQPNTKRRSLSDSKPAPKLRTAARKSRKLGKSSRSGPRATSPSEADTTSTPDDSLTAEELRARRSHNMVEKQYRNRLNAQFERLLSALPVEQQRPQQGANGEGSTDDKRMSKAEVLDVATRRIKELENERRLLQRERQLLLQDMGVLSGKTRRVSDHF